VLNDKVIKPLPDWVVYAWITMEILLFVVGIIGAIFVTPWMGLFCLVSFALLMA
jgi:hypothetical protein